MHTLQQLISGELKGTKRLRLSCGLTKIPVEVFDLADTLEILDLSGNQLVALPDNFHTLSKLRIAFFSDNLFTVFPTILAKCSALTMIGFKANKISQVPEHAFPPKLRWLILTNNQITTLPSSIGESIYLQKVMFAGNKLKELPVEMASCKRIELLRISANNFDNLPGWLLHLPRLSWLAYSGNPFCVHEEVSDDMIDIHWDELEILELLGEGASGVISKAHLRAKSVDVAVKIFKGEVTSDGLPSDEMDICMVAGLHPNLVQILGKLCEHPDHKKGLVMNLIPSTYKNLGGPPDFTTCTRDTFSLDTVFSGEQIIHIAKGIASVAAHLHNKGIMHGDLYAHNILIGESAHPILSDFGAAAFYDRASNTALLLERIEVRAYGCLIDDLLNHVLAADRSSDLVFRLNTLKDACMNEDIMQRPAFDSIIHTISLI